MILTFDYFFFKYVEKIQFALKSNKKKKYFTSIPMYFYDLAEFF